MAGVSGAGVSERATYSKTQRPERSAADSSAPPSDCPVQRQALRCQSPPSLLHPLPPPPLPPSKRNEPLAQTSAGARLTAAAEGRPAEARHHSPFVATDGSGPLAPHSFKSALRDWTG